MEAPMNNLYIGLLRLENRAAFFVHAKASQVTPRETAEERFHTLARGWLAYPVTPVACATTAEVRLYKHTEANALQTGSPPKTKFPTAKPQPETV